MSRTLILACLFVLHQLCCNELHAQNVYLSKNVDMSFFSEARVENISAQSKEGTAAVNISTGEMMVKVRIKSFHFKNGLMEEHFNENYMETDKFPEAIFKGSIIEKLDSTKVAEFPITIKGMLTVHGVQKERTLKGLAIFKDNQIILSSDFLMPVSDHNIEIPNDKISNIAQNIQVKIHATFFPKK